ncbi:P-loop containing nucleoside triphosphate hydrolase protein [Xylaria intraflava]|nr:P-loop containing nucleoside triphosphate hydrolase protein [Xylaria intraflava]
MTLYNHNTDPQSQARWSEFQDPVAEEKRLKELGKAFAVIHRQSKVEKDGLTSWVTTSLEAQSPRLRELLDTIFSDYPSWYPDGQPYAVAPPFQPYVHRWEAFLGVCRRNHPDEKTADELQLLRRELASRIDGSLSALDKVRKTGAISFQNLWLLWNPGSLVMSSAPGPIRVFKFVQATFTPATRVEPAHYDLTLAHAEWNGGYCGLGASHERVVEYKEPISVKKLPVYPVEFADRWEGIERSLIARGRKSESLRGYHIKTCEGKKYTIEVQPLKGLVEVEKPVSGRVIVDAHAYYKVQNRVPPALIPLADARRSLNGLRPRAPIKRPAPQRFVHRRNSSGSSSSSSSLHSSSSSSSDDDTPNIPRPPIIPIPVGTSPNWKDGERREDMTSLTDAECIITSPRVKGFHLSAKEWCELNVDEIEDVQWDDSPYDNLVLPDGERELVFAFADRPRFSKQGFDDFVAHKGEGIIILLCGPPGVGKTLTAEAVAEKSRAPLYIVSASDLGSTAASVDKGLSNALECCQLWDAVLLIDEADIFLESRDSNNLQRNELVSIFLRRLEYYRGLMFLTTNRSTAIDSAFRSRIDLILPYVDLDEANRRRIWANFIRKLRQEVASISDTDLDELAKAPLNGREIKNTIKTALVLANTDKPLRLKHLRVVLSIRKRVALLDHNDQSS